MIRDEHFSIEKLIFETFTARRKKFKGSDEEFARWFKKKLPKALRGVNKTIRETAVKFGFSESKRKAKEDRILVKKIAERYKDSLPFFDIFIELNLQIGRNFYGEQYKLLDDFDSHLKLDALIEIHSRACQIASETRLLVKHGYSDGAHARWRSLHELCIIFLFLYDNNSEVVKMYLDYSVVELWDKVQKHKEAYPKLGWKGMSEKNIITLGGNRQMLIDKYGQEFAKSYGWTMRVLPPGKRNIRGIEESVGKDYLRGIYSWASENIHAGISGNRTRLGMPEGKERYFLTGPTEHGLFDPVQYTSYSLMEMSQTLLNATDSMLNKFLSELLLDIRFAIVDGMNKSDKKKKLKSPGNIRKRKKK